MISKKLQLWANTQPHERTVEELTICD